MINYLIFTIASSVQYIGMFVLMFSLFRIHYRWYIPQIVFVCISLSYLSYTMRISDQVMYATFVQIGSIIVLMWLLFRFQIFYAVVMAITGSIIFAMLDLFIAFFVSLYSIQIDQFSIEMYIVAIISGSIAIGIAHYIRRKNWGFSYVPHSEDAAVNYKEKENLMLLVVAVLSVVSFAGTYFFTAQFRASISFLIVSLLLLLSSMILIIISRNKDRKEVN